MKENKDYAQRMMEHYVNNPPPSEAEGIIEALKEEVRKMDALSSEEKDRLSTIERMQPYSNLYHYYLSNIESHYKLPRIFIN